MDRQKTLPLGTREERAEAVRRYLAPLCLRPRELAVLCLVAGHGQTCERADQELWRWSGPLAIAARKAGCAKATFLAAVRDLVEREVLTVVNSRPQTYVVNWSRLVILLDQIPA